MSLRGRRAGAALALAAGAAFPGSAYADLPLWELGIGAGALRVPHYRGSDQNHDWLLPVPYVVYRGEIFRSDREGTRAVLLDTERLDLTLSVGASPPASSGDDRARAGMPDLSPTIEVGPNANVNLGKGGDWKLDLRLPLRAVATVRSHPRMIGWTFSPVLNLDLRVQGWNLGLQGGPLAASQRYHAYFYDVDPIYATADRPAYHAGSGFAGWVATVAASRRVGDWWLAGFWRVDSLAGATFVDSPLVKTRSNSTFGIAASWIFKTSDSRVPGRP